MNAASDTTNRDIQLTFENFDVQRFKGKGAIPQSSPRESSLTEIVFTRHSKLDNLLLFPMLAHLSQDADRWITWFISEPPESALLRHYGVNLDKVRIVRAGGCKHNAGLLGEALSNGRSHTVIASFDAISREEIDQLEESAARGQSKALIIRYR